MAFSLKFANKYFYNGKNHKGILLNPLCRQNSQKDIIKPFMLAKITQWDVVKHFTKYFKMIKCLKISKLFCIGF